MTDSPSPRKGHPTVHVEGGSFEDETAWHSLPVEEVFEELGSSTAGLTAEEGRARLERHGQNEIPGEGDIDALGMALSQLKNPLNAVLAAAAIISFFAGKTVDMVVITIIIVFNTAMGFIQEYRAEKALQTLKSMTSLEAEVIRRSERDESHSVEMRIKASDVVPGDVVLLEAGDKVPADARVFEAANLDIDESMLTGESTSVSKKTDPDSASAAVADRKCIVYSGSIVTQGRGRAVVFSTGMRTEMGKIAKLIGETEDVETPIQRRIRDLSKKLGMFALFASTLTLVIGLVRGFEFMEILLFALASAVSAIPEGLLVVMTITLAIGAHRMVRRNALIRKLQAVETLGSVTAICTDKTGTLTTNQMTMREVTIGGRRVRTTGVGYAPEGRFEVDGEPVDVSSDKDLDLVLRTAALCNDSRLREHKTEDGVRWEVNGDPTEGALVVAAEKAGIRAEDLASSAPRTDEIPFDSERRYMATFHDAGDGCVMVCVKGAPETVLGMCCEVTDAGDSRDITDDDLDKANASARRMAGEAMRVLGVAYQMIDKEDLADFKSKLEEKVPLLTFLGLVGMIDPPRPEAKGAVKLCKAAGIKVLMLTGDHRLTAEAIAGEIGILGKGGIVVEGKDLDDMDDEELDRKIDDIRVFARVSPSHKHRIVEALRRRKHIVAMTGDGVNDAPALKAAEVGISMGITGSDVTKETAEMVLADDNFASIVNAVEEGRVVFENIRKVTKYLISTNTGEIITIQAALILMAPGNPLILTPIMVLWINLVTDGLLDKTLALEPKEDDVMKVPPRRPDEKVIDKAMIQNVVILAVFMATGTLFLFKGKLGEGDAGGAQTIAFATMAMFQVFNSLNCKSRTKSVLQTGLLRNKWLLVAIVASAGLTFLATSVPVLQTALGTTALTTMDWAKVVLIASSILVVDEVRKFVRPKVEQAIAQ